MVECYVILEIVKKALNLGVIGMPIHAFTRDIEVYIKSHYGLVCIETVEEVRAEQVVGLISFNMNLKFAQWCSAEGLQIQHNKPIMGTKNFLTALNQLDAVDFEGILLCKGFPAEIDQYLATQSLFNLIKKFSGSKSAIVIVGTGHVVPDKVKPYSAFVEMPLPSKQELREMVIQVGRELEKRSFVNVNISGSDLDRLIHNLAGLTMVEAKKIITVAIIEDNTLDASDIERVVEAKKNIISQEGVLEYYPVDDNMSEVAGLDNLKGWLEKRKNILMKPEQAKQYGLEFPKGILLLGIPGTGKSLSAKAVSKSWSMPLLKMDTGSLYNKFIGETEKNFKKATDVAERMSPVILWIDEIEKAFSQGDSSMDGGLSQRILGTFLSWMQDRKGEVFIIATANDIESLPPEFLRKGRFDEIFFVDLPKGEDREKIFEIQLRKRNQATLGFDLNDLSFMTEGFSGAEIEQVVVGALYTAFSKNELLTDAHIKEEITGTKPLSVTRAEDLMAMRSWAKDRAVIA